MAEAPVPGEGGKSVGTLLREARESRGGGLEEAVRVTRIGRNYLMALEGDAFDRLPNPAYAKGFIRVYADYLGLSADDLVSRYEESLNPPRPAVRPQEGGPSVGRAGEVGQPRNRWAIPLVLLVLVLFSAYFTRERGEPLRSAERPPTVKSLYAPPLPVQTALSSASVSAPAPTAARSEMAEEPSGGEAISPSPASRGIVLRLKINQDCWLNMTIDRTLSQQYDLKAGDLIEWKGEQVFSLDLGNAGGVEAEFNGKSLPPFGESGRPAHVVLTAEGSGEQ